MEYLRDVFGKKQIKFLISAGVTLVVFLILLAIGAHIAAKQKDQNLTKRWSDTNDFAQVTCMFTELAGFSENSMKSLKMEIEEALKQESLVPANENARNYLTAMSAKGEAILLSKDTELAVRAFGVDGDFFMFHPLDMISGSYFDGDDIMQDHIILDEVAAWNLFGSTNIVGQVVMIDEIPHIVSGVYRRSDDRINRLAGNDVATVFMSISALKEHGQFTYINSCEVMMPNPIDDFAKNIVTESIGIDESKYDIFENSNRFHWTKLWQIVSKYGTRGMNSKGIVTPYWENVARGVEDILAPICVVACALLAYTFVVVALTLLRMWKLRRIHFKDIMNLIGRLVDRYRARKYEKIERGEYI